MEGFFFAETLKYLYVLLGPPNTINLKTTVLNAEAPPLAPHLVDAKQTAIICGRLVQPLV
jgi:hypothetical protein